jgi:HlyD family secretion protein
MSARRSTDARLAALFPELSQGTPRRRWWQRPKGAVVIGVTAVALLGGGTLVARTSGADAVSYRTATAQLRDVGAVYRSVATIEPVSQATVGFPVSGTVATVDVEVGDTVTLGEQLATLDTVSLEQALRARQAELDQAELVLSKALAGEDVGATSGGSSGGAAGGTASGTAQPTSTSDAGTTGVVLLGVATDGSTTSDQLVAAQQAVLSAQQTVDSTLLSAEQALASATEICAAIDVAVDDTALDDAGVDGSSTTTALDAAAGSTEAELTACRDALDQVLAAQTAVSVAQRDLATASSALDALRSQAASSTGDTSGGSSAGAPSGSGSSGGASSGSGSSGGASVQGSSSTSPSSEDLIAYQKAVDAAALQVAVAIQAVAQAGIVAPIQGTVVAVGLAVGDEATSGSATQQITIQGEGGYEVTTTVGVDEVAELEIGQPAKLLPDGSDAVVEGQVVSIALTGDSTYRVVVGLTGDTSGLRNGATGTVSIVTGSARDALAVPTSAVTASGDRHTVTVISDGRAEDVQVVVGVVGDTWTEITSGLASGDVVALADLNEPLPGAATETTSSGTSAGSFAGGPPQFQGGMAGGGFPGGGGG